MRALAPFITAYNLISGADYQFEQQLDSSGQLKQPEARYLGSTGALVVERKSLIWPKNFAKYHQTMHVVSSMVAARIDVALDPAKAYKLTIPDGIRIGRRECELFAENIARTILGRLPDVHDGQSIGSTHRGREWHFREEARFEREYYENTVGLKFEYPGSIDPLDWGEVTDGFSDELSRLLGEADKKFSSHQDARKCVVLDPYGSARWSTDETWLELLERATIPDTVDEVWLSMHDQLMDLACGWIHRCLWPVLGPENHTYCGSTGDVNGRSA